MFGKSRHFKDPVLAVIKDGEGRIFGAFATEPWHPHIGHFGTGECFLWRLEKSDDGKLNKVRRWKSTGENDYYMLCETGFIAAGCGESKFGLWLDAQLECGNSHSVPTYWNEPLAVSDNFVCMSFELWGLKLEE
jgi:hypothetical protein